MTKTELKEILFDLNQTIDEYADHDKLVKARRDKWAAAPKVDDSPRRV